MLLLNYFVVKGNRNIPFRSFSLFSSIQGFLIVPNFFDIENELNPVIEAINELVETTAERLFRTGKIKGSLMHGLFNCKSN